MQCTTEVSVCLCLCLCMCVCVSESGRAVVANTGGDPDQSPTRAGFHHDEVTLVLLVLNSLSNHIQSYARIVPRCGFVRNCAYISAYVRVFCFLFFFVFLFLLFLSICILRIANVVIRFILPIRVYFSSVCFLSFSFFFFL